jgi:hypothetical protein
MFKNPAQNKKSSLRLTHGQFIFTHFDISYALLSFFTEPAQNISG